ncbi:MAG: tol-pal system YbgF family protein [Promethearchaeota archaeon]
MITLPIPPIVMVIISLFVIIIGFLIGVTEPYAGVVLVLLGLLNLIINIPGSVLQFWRIYKQSKTGERAFIKSYQTQRRKLAKTQSRLTYGIKEFEKQNYGRAIEDFKAVLKDSSLTGKMEMEVLGLIARSYLLKKDWTEALNYADQVFSLGLAMKVHPSYENYLVRIESALKTTDLQKAYSTLIVAKEKFGSKPELEKVESLLTPYMRDIEGKLPLICPKCGLAYQRGNVPAFCFSCNEILIDGDDLITSFDEN